MAEIIVLTCQITTTRDGSKAAYLTTREDDKFRSQRLEMDSSGIVDWSCDCKFGSAYRFAKQFVKLKTKCKHYKYCIAYMKDMGIINE